MPSIMAPRHHGTKPGTEPKNKSPTNLSPNHLRQRANKLRRGIDTQLDRFLIDNPADGEPESGLEALDGCQRC